MGLGGVTTASAAGSTWLALLRLARPRQWAKGVFVLVGPLYGAAEGKPVDWPSVLLAVVAFGLAASGSYVVNDIRDREADRAHPRKRERPIASGAVGIGRAWVFAGVLLAASAAACAVLVLGPAGARGGWVTTMVGVYVANVMLYSMRLKHVVIVDVVCLALGFSLRVLGGCAAGGVEPSTWLLNVTLFAAMFLGFAKRLGERRGLAAAGVDTSVTRKVQADYSNEVLRLALGLTAVATLVTYAGYVQARGDHFTATLGGWGFNLLWLTVPPAVLALLRAVVLVEKGRYDDPTELAWGDRGFQGAVLLFAATTALAIAVA
jgi:decaprenyl-phosphate phosphoribosyltransferase